MRTMIALLAIVSVACSVDVADVDDLDSDPLAVAPIATTRQDWKAPSRITTAAPYQKPPPEKECDDTRCASGCAMRNNDGHCACVDSKNCELGACTGPDEFGCDACMGGCSTGCWARGSCLCLSEKECDGSN